jgi:hypothetical protein
LAWFAGAPCTQAAVLSQDWNGSTLTLHLDDGKAELEWISPVAFRFARSWGESSAALPAITHDPIAVAMEQDGGTVKMRTKYLRVELDQSDLKLRMKNGETPVTELALASGERGIDLRLALRQNEKIFGLAESGSGRLNLRGERIRRSNGFFFTSVGYGMFMRSPEPCVFDLAGGKVEAPGARSIEYTFYYGPTVKEILEQHQAVTGQSEVKQQALDLLAENALPPAAARLPKISLASWDGLATLVRTLNQWSLSAVLYPAFDLSAIAAAPAGIRERARDLATLLPILYGSPGDISADLAARNSWKPYLITYLREAHDRGYPIIRPLPMQFSRDANADQHADVFMLGDEFLLAPVVSASGTRRVDLPVGLWTDLRTNVEYRGKQTVEVGAPAGRVPTFVRNGSLFPMAAEGKMELHYFPSLGGEFFLWEPGPEDNSQFHAAPAGDFVRVEIESQVRRTYEWVIHHTQAARQVSEAPKQAGEDAKVYEKVADRANLKPGAWWHDAALNDLHLVLRVEPGEDRIVNISF